MEIPIAVTTQVTSKFGPTVPSILSKLPNNVPSFDKTRFSMTTSEVSSFLKVQKAKNIVIVGIEAHICVAQSAMGV
jgi:nicotinamidase-related amidase